MNLISKLICRQNRWQSANNYWMCFTRQSLYNTYNSSNDINRRRYSSAVRLSECRAEAERIIGQPLAHFSVRNLLRDEFDLKVFTINKVNSERIAHTQHPIIDIARDMFDEDLDQIKDLNSITNGQKLDQNSANLLLLLLAKCSESLPSFPVDPDGRVVLQKQSDFAEIYSMISKALFIHHAAVVNIPVLPVATQTLATADEEDARQRLNDANKISILGGDYLLSYAIVRLANLVNNNQVLRLIMCAIDDYCIYHFSNNGQSVADGLAIPDPKSTVLDWEEMAGYSLTKMLAYSSQIMLLLAKQSDRFQKAAFDVGYYSQLLWILKDEMNECFNGKDNPLKLLSAPIIFHMTTDPTFHDYLQHCSRRQEFDFAKIRQMVASGESYDKCKQYIDLYANKAIKSLDVFPDSAAKSVLTKAIVT